MPTYDYRCCHCVRISQIVHAMSDSKPACPHCGGELQQLILSAPALHGDMSRGRERAIASLPECGKSCRCCP